jgi:hypothetical protein
MPCIFAVLKSTGLVAQGLEHRTHNPRVAGSIPARPTLFVKHTLTGVLFVFRMSITRLFRIDFWGTYKGINHHRGRKYRNNLLLPNRRYGAYPFHDLKVYCFPNFLMAILCKRNSPSRKQLSNRLHKHTIKHQSR